MEEQNLTNFKKKQTIKLTVLVLSLVAIIASVSYAFFAAGIGGLASTDIDATSEVSENSSFIPGEPINIHATLANFGENMGSLSGETTSSAKLIASSSVGSASLDYQVYFKIDTNDFEYTVDSNTPEMIITVTDPEGNELTAIDGLTPVTVTDALTSETISGFDVTTFTGLIKIAEDYNISTTSSTDGTQQDWKVKLTFVNLDTLQTANEGKTFSGQLLLQTEKLYSNGAEYIIGALYDGTEGNNGIYYTNNAEYRYTGANPNNYVTFNDELWRIIGVFDENSHGQTEEKLIKIIKSDYIDKNGNGTFEIGNNGADTYVYDSGNDNSWASTDGSVADLNEELNGNYYNNILNADAKAMLKKVMWYLGGSNTSASAPASVMYGYERGSLVSSGTSETYKANIGLMYVSDYGYAASPSGWSTNLSGYSLTAIKETNWLVHDDLVSQSGREWTITAPSFTNSSVAVVYYSGDAHTYSANSGYVARPSLYLNSSVEITGGTGSEADPFTLR